jgi:hypothetical protein
MTRMSLKVRVWRAVVKDSCLMERSVRVVEQKENYQDRDGCSTKVQQTRVVQVSSVVAITFST